MSTTPEINDDNDDDNAIIIENGKISSFKIMIISNNHHIPSYTIILQDVIINLSSSMITYSRGNFITCYLGHNIHVPNCRWLVSLKKMIILRCFSNTGPPAYHPHIHYVY